MYQSPSRYCFRHELIHEMGMGRKENVLGLRKLFFFKGIKYPLRRSFFNVKNDKYHFLYFHPCIDYHGSYVKGILDSMQCSIELQPKKCNTPIIMKVYVIWWLKRMQIVQEDLQKMASRSK